MVQDKARVIEYVFKTSPNDSLIERHAQGYPLGVYEAAWIIQSVPYTGAYDQSGKMVETHTVV